MSVYWSPDRAMENKPKHPAPICPYCQGQTVLVNGGVIYPHRPDLADKLFWQCAPCDAYVGCHPNTDGRPLGKPANAELRRARRILHDRMIDPLWKNAIASEGYQPENEKAAKKIMRAARNRVYEYLADKLGLTKDETHGGEFDLETCQRAWGVLRGVRYATIRAWAHERHTIDGKQQEPTATRAPQPGPGGTEAHVSVDDDRSGERSADGSEPALMALASN